MPRPGRISRSGRKAETRRGEGSEEKAWARRTHVLVLDALELGDPLLGSVEPPSLKLTGLATPFLPSERGHLCWTERTCTARLARGLRHDRATEKLRVASIFANTKVPLSPIASVSEGQNQRRSRRMDGKLKVCPGAEEMRKRKESHLFCSSRCNTTCSRSKKRGN